MASTQKLEWLEQDLWSGSGRGPGRYVLPQEERLQVMKDFLAALTGLLLASLIVSFIFPLLALPIALLYSLIVG